MSGILETILAEIQNLNVAVRALQGATPALGQLPPAAPGYTQAATPVQQYNAPVTPPAVQQQPPPSNITADAITALIQPHIGNEAIKAALGAAMRAMGINALPETQPHQFGALYQAFQAVIAQHTQAQAPAAGNGMSII